MVLKRIDRFILGGITLAVLAMMLFWELAEDVWHREMLGFDALAIQWLSGFTSAPLTQGMIFFTHLGSAAVLLAVCLLVLLILQRHGRPPAELLLVLLSLSGGWVANVLLKLLFQRPRPDFGHLVEVTGFSFPSGHAMVSLSFYGFLAFLYWQGGGRRPRRYLAAALAGMLISLIGVSRVYLGVHYPSDVLAGFSAGLVCLLACAVAWRILVRQPVADAGGSRRT